MQDRYNSYDRFQLNGSHPDSSKPGHEQMMEPVRAKVEEKEIM